MRTIRADDWWCSVTASDELVPLLVNGVRELGADFPFLELSEEEVVEVYRRMSGRDGNQLTGWWGKKNCDDAHSRLQGLIREGRMKYVFLPNSGDNELVDFGDVAYYAVMGDICWEMMSRHRKNRLNLEQVPETLWEQISNYQANRQRWVIEGLGDHLTPLEVLNGPLRHLRVFSHLVPPKTSLIWRGVMGHPGAGGTRPLSKEDVFSLWALTHLWSVLGRGRPCPVLVARQTGEALAGGWEEASGLGGPQALLEALLDGALVMVDPDTGQKEGRMAETRRWLLGDGT